jgi:hypothetical protein
MHRILKKGFIDSSKSGAGIQAYYFSNFLNSKILLFMLAFFVIEMLKFDITSEHLSFQKTKLL